MTTLQQVKALLPGMSADEKVQVMHWVQQDLHYAPGIEKTPGVCGGRACIIRTRIPVWSLVESRRMGAKDAHLLENYPSLRPADLENAWNYYRLYSAEIEADILDNQMEDV
jgi:uncharacterized protein (DUF433 family)